MYLNRALKDFFSKMLIHSAGPHSPVNLSITQSLNYKIYEESQLEEIPFLFNKRVSMQLQKFLLNALNSFFLLP